MLWTVLIVGATVALGAFSTVTFLVLSSDDLALSSDDDPCSPLGVPGGRLVERSDFESGKVEAEVFTFNEDRLVGFQVWSEKPADLKYEWAELDLEAPDGERTSAVGDNSVSCYPVAGSEWLSDPEAHRPIDFLAVDGLPIDFFAVDGLQRGTYTVLYDGYAVAEAELVP